MTEFVGFNLPLWFRGIIPESLAVRNSAGIFDVSHMGRALVRGKDSQKLLNTVTTNDVSALGDDEGQYSLMCNHEGGIKDDVLVFRLKEHEHFIVYNAGNRSKDYDWIVSNAKGLEVEVSDVSKDVAMFAVQGPKAESILQRLSNSDLAKVPRFGCQWAEIAGVRALVSRTGYTGEDGFEVYVWNSPVDNPKVAVMVWEKILDAGRMDGLEPCGLGARDLLRLEAGLCLYGTDMDERTNPYEARLGFVVRLQKDFIGRDKLQEVRRIGTARVRVGLVTLRRVIPRHGFNITYGEKEVGAITSGTLSPLLNTGIAMGYVNTQLAKEANVVSVQIRERREEAKIVKTPFYDSTKYGYARKTPKQ